MTRLADHKYKDKRRRSLLLNVKAFLILKQIQKNAKRTGKEWSFSNFVNQCLINKYGDVLSEKDYLIQELKDLQAERDNFIQNNKRLEEEYTNKLIALNDKLGRF